MTTQDTTPGTPDAAKAREALYRMIQRQGHMRIPARPDDDDLLLSDYLDAVERQAAELAALREKVAQARDKIQRAIEMECDPGNVFYKSEGHIRVAIHEARRLLAPDVPSEANALE